MSRFGCSRVCDAAHLSSSLEEPPKTCVSCLCFHRRFLQGHRGSNILLKSLLASTHYLLLKPLPYILKVLLHNHPRPGHQNLHYFAGSAKTSTTDGWLLSRDVFPHNSEGSEPKVRVWAGLAPLEVSLLVCRWPSSPYVFVRPSLRASVTSCPLFFF